MCVALDELGEEDPVDAHAADVEPAQALRQGPAREHHAVMVFLTYVATNPRIWAQLKDMLVHFDLGFEIMPGTGAKDLTPEQDAFEQEDLGRTDGG